MSPDIQKLKARAEALEGHVLTLANTRMHLDMSQWSEISNAVLDARSTILALIEVAEAAEDVLSSLEYDQSSYDRNGPSFTSPSGTQYELTANVLVCSEERANILRTALEGLTK